MSTITYIVKVASGKFTIDDAVAPKLTFRDGDTYVFDQADNSNSGHILQFSATSNNSGSSEYTTGVTKTGTAGSAGAKTTIVTSGSTTDTLYYYSSGGGTHGSEFSNSGFKTSSNFNFLKPIVGASSTAEKWGPMVNHMVDQIDQNISAQDLDGATDSGTVAVDLDTQSLTVAGSNGIATSGSGQTITVSGEALAFQGEPHIIPNVLYPAVAGRLLDGSTSHSGNYGTAQSDGRSYYYTDIKGSKPIKDPRIGGHFGSQRYRITSKQILEQETATHGKDVCSLDGREFFRGVALGNITNDTKGITAQMGDDAFMEITGYFNAVNLLLYTFGYTRAMSVTVDGVTAHSAFASNAGVDTPLRDRYVHANHVINIPLTASGSSLSTDTTLGIHTLRIYGTNGQGAHYPCGFELIAQDKFTDATCDYNNDPTITHDANTRIVAGLTVTGTGIPANATVASVTSSTEFELSAATTGGAVTNGTLTFGTNNIQIPSQNVVSYGKKFTVSDNPHYDPFNGFTSGNASAVAGLIDTATSLGYKEWTYSGNTFTDSGEHTQTITVAGTPHHTEAKSKIGASSMYFDGADDYLSIPDHADFDVGSNFTVEAWVWPQDDGNVNDSGVIWSHSNAGNDQINFSISTLGRLTFEYYKASASLDIYIASDNNKITYQAWNHVAAVRTSDVWKLYINGIESTNITNTTGTSTASVFTSSAPVRIGTRWTGSAFSLFNGYIDELRQSKVSRYSANFTPPTTAFTSDSDTALLIHSNTVGTYYRPYNGGRVVKWVDSSGTIKTSVNMMPPNATSNEGVSSNQKIASSANNIYTPTFSGSIDHSLSEVAKTFHWREFGNGAANGGTGATYADASMLSPTKDNIAYVMDDGLTSLSGVDAKENNGTALPDDNSGDGFYFTFIGTGFTLHEGYSTPDVDHLVQNLPYGTHVISYFRGNSVSAPTLIVDGVTITCNTGSYGRWNEVTFHQPKKPPIPEDAVVLADYMLMADYVAKTTEGIQYISKGVRLCSASRDIFYDASSGSISLEASNPDYVQGFNVYNSGTPSAGVHKATYPAFATRVNSGGHSDRRLLYVDGSAVTQGKSTTAATGQYNTQTDASTLGLHTFGSYNAASTNGNMSHMAFATPIHTSSHYQPFETPFLYELVGGDRNMEQNNLIVTPDGKIWDEVTRDTSYIGNVCINTGGDTAYTGDGDINIFDEWRGTTVNGHRNGMNKDFAIAYDRMICLKSGYYSITNRTLSYNTTTQDSAGIRRNGTSLQPARYNSINYETPHNNIVVWLNRGDYIQSNGWRYPDIEWNNFFIERA